MTMFVHCVSAPKMLTPSKITKVTITDHRPVLHMILKYSGLSTLLQTINVLILQGLTITTGYVRMGKLRQVACVTETLTHEIMEYPLARKLICTVLLNILNWFSNRLVKRLIYYYSSSH
jgi:hypothetical protein